MFSADPPSTPNRSSPRGLPSTTPAGPPPSLKLTSFTPKGLPPPSSTFGSSRLGSGASMKPLSTNGLTRGRAPGSSPPNVIPSIDDEESDEEMDGAPPGPGEDSIMVDDSTQQISPGFTIMSSIGNSKFRDSPRGNKRTRTGDVLRSSVQTPRNVGGYDFRGLAKGAAATAPAPTLRDTDDLILETERLTEPLAAALAACAGPEEYADLGDELVDSWAKSGALKQEEIESEEIGPPASGRPISRAFLVGSLATQLHLPHFEDGSAVPLPKRLLEWLDKNHDPSADVVSEVLAQRQGYYAAPGFWDAVYLSLNRGKFAAVIQLLEGAEFESNMDSDLSEKQQDGIEYAVSSALDLLEECPAIKSSNWDVKGSDWVLFRHQVQRASEALWKYAEVEPNTGSIFESSLLGKSDTKAMSVRSRHIDSRVPFEIYEGLQEMYKQMQGNAADVLKSCMDWLDAAILNAVWWDGNEELAGKGSLAASRRGMNRHNRAREADLNPAYAYRKQLAISFGLAMTETDVKESFDVTNDLHLALACVLLDDLENAIDLVKTWSLPVASSIAELATAGQWIAGTARGTVENFDKSDLMVLSYGQEKQRTSMKDGLLEIYAGLLARRASFRSTATDMVMDGWEMALRVLSRIDDTELAQARVTELLDSITFHTNDQIDNVLVLCNDLGFSQHAVSITEKYADKLSDSTRRYGDALLYYLRAHKFAKAKRIIDVLITSCLVQSTAYPPKPELDFRMSSFIESPKATLNTLASIDFEAAQKLASWLSGYATLRKFYNLRDTFTSSTSSSADAKEAERRTCAATALLTVIESAGSPIRGGLFDPSTEIVVPLDSLLVLVGEALPLLKLRAFSLPQLFALLRVVEDLQTIGPRILGACETVFQTALDGAFGGEVPSPRAMLRKEGSGAGMVGSAFSLVGSSMLGSAEHALLGGSAEGSAESGVLVPNPAQGRRGWDWRKGLKRTSKAEDVLRILRLVLAERVGDAWAAGES